MRINYSLALLIVGYTLLIFAAADLAGWAFRPMDLNAPFNRNAAGIVLLTGFGAGAVGLGHRKEQADGQ